MGKRYEKISDDIRTFIEKQNIFFVGTAVADGRINVSPKGGDTFRVLNESRIVWLNLTGSGNETAAHLSEQDRITIMFCAFEGKPMILRLYGHAKIYSKDNKHYQELIHLFPDIPGSRQIIDMQVDLVQTSCGMAVPLMEYKADRKELNKWAAKQGDERLIRYRREKNTTSIDGKPIKI